MTRTPWPPTPSSAIEVAIGSALELGRIDPGLAKRIGEADLAFRDPNLHRRVEPLHEGQALLALRAASRLLVVGDGRLGLGCRSRCRLHLRGVAVGVRRSAGRSRRSGAIGLAVSGWMIDRVEDPDLVLVEELGTLGRALEGLAVEGEHLVRAREPDPPAVVLDALAGDVHEAEAVPLDRLADRVAQVLLVVDGRLGVERVR